MKITKGLSFAAWLVGILLAVIASGQTWFTLEMKPADTVVTIQSFDGFTTFGYISPVLMLAACQGLIFFFSGPVARSWIGWASVLTSALLTVALAFDVLSQNIANLGPAIENATGIAATHGIDGVTVVTEIGGYLAILSLALLVAVQATATVTSRTWPARKARTERAVVKEGAATDTISMWDSQR